MDNENQETFIRKNKKRKFHTSDEYDCINTEVALKKHEDHIVSPGPSPLTKKRKKKTKTVEEDENMISDKLGCNDVDPLAAKRDLSINVHEITKEKKRKKDKKDHISEDTTITQNPLHHKKTSKKRTMEQDENLSVSSAEFIELPEKTSKKEWDNIDSSTRNGINDKYKELNVNKIQECNDNQSKSIEMLDDAIRKTDKETQRMLSENEHLRDLHIEITWKMSPSHQIETAVGVRPTKRQNQMFKRLEFPMKTGPFIKKEDKMIQNNFKEFCEEYNLNHDPAPFMIFVHSGKSVVPFKERLKFVQYIGKGLNDRKLWRIYCRFQVLHANVTKGKFSPQEDKTLLEYIKTHEHDKYKFSNLAKILDRTRTQIQKRYYAITQLEQFTKIPSHQKVEELVSAMMAVLGTTTVKEMRAKKIEDRHWLKISSRLDDTPVYELKSFWRLSVKTRLFNQNIKINKVMCEIIQRLHQQKVEDWKQLNWQEIAKPYKQNHYTSAFLYSKFKDLKRMRVPKEYHDKPRTCIRMLRDFVEQCPMVCNKVRSYRYIDGCITKV